MLYALIANDKPGILAQRLEHRPEHLKHLEALGQRLKLAGALLDGAGNAEGSIVVVEAETFDEAEALLTADPFITRGIFGDYKVRPWRLAFNHLAGG